MQTASPIINTVTTPAMEIGSSTGIFDPGNVEDGKPTTSLARFSTSTRLAELKYNNSARTEAMEFHMREYEKLQKDRDILEIAARDFEAMEKQATRILHSLGELG